MRQLAAIAIHHESLADVINGSLISFTMDGDVLHCVSAREKHSNEAQYLSSFNLNDIAKHAGLWLIPRHFEMRGIFDVPRPITVIYVTDEATLQQLDATRGSS